MLSHNVTSLLQTVVGLRATTCPQEHFVVVELSVLMSFEGEVYRSLPLSSLSSSRLRPLLENLGRKLQCLKYDEQ